MLGLKLNHVSKRGYWYQGNNIQRMLATFFAVTRPTTIIQGSLVCSSTFNYVQLFSTTTRAGASTEHTSTSTGKSVLEYSVFSIFMFIILGKTSTRVVLAPALTTTQDIDVRGSDLATERKEWCNLRFEMLISQVARVFLTCKSD